MADLTKVGGVNPTKSLEMAYAELMMISDPDALAQRVIEIARTGMSDRNFTKFRSTVNGLRHDLPQLRQYVTNFILAGCGLRVV